MEYMEIIRKLRVKFGYIFSLMLIVFAKPRSFPLFVIGSIVASIGEFFRVWAATYIVKLDRLTTCGPYKATRNPLYFGSFLLGTGLLIIAFNPIIAAVYYVLYLAIYPATMSAESRELEKKFHDDYIDYKNSTPVFCPDSKGMEKAIADSGDIFTKFSERFKNFLKNREYNGVLALVAVLVILYWKLNKNLKSK